MNLYLISQDVNNDYDTYDSAVVAAESEEEARGITNLQKMQEVLNKNIEKARNV